MLAVQHQHPSSFELERPTKNGLARLSYVILPGLAESVPGLVVINDDEVWCVSCSR